MPPRQKVTRLSILNAAADIVRESGPDAINARSVAAKIGCSTQPIFSNYASIEALKADLLRHAFELYETYVAKALRSTEYPPYKAAGMAYIRFAREESALFRLLFMQKHDPSEREDRSFLRMVTVAGNAAGLPEEAARKLHLELWMFGHGIASMIATNYLEWDKETVSGMMSDAYLALSARFKNEYERN